MSKHFERFLYIITFFAGFSFLVYEVSWNRYLSYILGSTGKASAIVLTTFMAGFGFGAYLRGKTADKAKKPVRLLAYLFSGVAIFNLINFLLISKLNSYLSTSSITYETSNLLLFSSATVLLIIPSFMMGSFIPIVSKILINNTLFLPSKFSRLYALETLGSVSGGLFTGFILLGTIGQANTMFFVVILNIVLGVALEIFAFRILPSQNGAKTNVNNVNTSKSVSKSDVLTKQALLTTAIFGFVILSLQMLWLRIFKTYFTNTSYTFAIITSFSVLGLSVGGFMFKKWQQKIADDFKFLSKLLIYIALTILVGFYISANLPEILLFPFKDELSGVYFRLIIAPTLASVLVILPPAIISGVSFPLISKIVVKNNPEIGQTIGKVLMFNTIGAIIAPFLTFFLLIPVFGIGKSIALLTTICISVYIFISRESFKNSKKIIDKGLIISTSIIVVFLFVKPDVRFLPPSLSNKSAEIVAYSETSEGTISLSRDAKKGVFGKSSFVNNSAIIGSNYDAVKAVKMVGHLPFFAGLECKKALVIGFGVGVTTSAIASHVEVQQIDCVELVPELTQYAFHYSDFNFDVQNDKRFNLISGDGRHFLELTTNKYDLISCDPTHPILGSGNLYTKEYFELCSKKLTDTGFLSQYLPLHKLRTEELLGILKTVHSVFPNTCIWLGQYHAVILSSKSDKKIDFKAWENRINLQDKDDFFYLDAYHIAANLFFSSEKISELTVTSKINTDDLSYTEFFNFDNFEEKNLSENLIFFNSNRSKINSEFYNIDNPILLEKYHEGNRKLTESMILASQKKSTEARQKLIEAVEINPEDQEFPFLIKLYYGK